MCGICGFTGASEADRSTLKAMCDVIAHRGPDGEGQYIDSGIAFGHRRLSLIDLEGGNQPMVRETGNKASKVTSPALNPDGMPREDEANAATHGEWAIVFNGEIYNYRELRSELEAEGWEFRTNSDTEVLLVGYIAWSEAVLQRLRGMFAFAIWNRSTRELFCARDFFGIKPFYYTTIENGDNPKERRFIFASEIKAILEHPAYTRELNERALGAYLCFQFSALQETFFKGIYKLPQGHCMRVSSDGTVEVGRYWKPEYAFDDSRDENDIVEEIHATMSESVRFHNVADVEVGSFLSSGIDSSYMAACLMRENPDIKTFTVGFSEYEGERDEISWARELAEKLGIENDSKHITEEEYWESLPHVQWHMDEPSADPSAVALYFVDQLAAKRVKAVLSGEGADEFFGGYRIYQTPLSNAKVAWAPRGMLRAGSKMLRGLGVRGANYLERASETVEDWYYTNANGVAFSPEERNALLAADVRERLQDDAIDGGARDAIGLGAGFDRAGHPGNVNGPAAHSISGLPLPQQLTAPVYEEVSAYDETTRMQYVDLWFWLVGDILLKTDKMSMAHSLESRVPFLDKEVFRVSATIPTRLKVTGEQTKVTLRQAAERAIPHDWAQKEKLGFPVPVAAWLREDRYYDRVKREFNSEEAAKFFVVDELMRLLDEHRAGQRDNTRRIWIVYMFLMWYRIYFVDRRKPVTN